MNRVAVTGLGLVCALGNNAPESWKRLAAGECRILPLSDPGSPPYKIRCGAEAWDFRPLDYFTEKDLVLLERFALMAAVAAREAVAQSGIRFTGKLLDRSAVITGSSVGGQFTEEEGYIRLYRNKDYRVAPLTIPRTMSNAGASRISLEFGIRGPAYTISTACSSSNHALGQAFWMVRSGQVIAAIAGGSEAVFAEGLMRAWEAMRVVTPDVCRPFSADRRGLSLGEGAGMLILENWEHATARGANILGEIAGFGMSSDAHHITQPCVEGPAKAMTWAIEDAGIAPEQVSYINAHGTGTQANDAIETQAIRTVFGQKADSILVSSTKSMHGHTLGAAGAIEGVATVLSLQNRLIPPTVNYTARDPACDLNIVANTAKAADIDVALSNTFAFGGLNATLVLKRGPN
ncbi:MAG: beta-ketoacyl-[acyl-carrier-protein] synthase family protein [Acidobacteriaceae bacterium]|nr:beta-ketoacyl-[acyl-carrier-protein] synthase family protein [Acidobacteriaceae bacterium]MBV9499113.1 beta-ketoacyl-[acyl-carrier-protein] synthase family protein [Acidobacteriaceae bacterium]